MKLQRRFAYKYGDVKHYKYVVTIPEEVVEKMEWKAGDEVDWEVGEGLLSLKRVAEAPPLTAEVVATPYKDFRDAIEKLLKAEPDGLTWSEIKTRLNLPQKVPNNKWVRQMEKDIGLTRTKESRGTVWRLN